jgi:uncharacterized protein involved in outer membrane biogenesis
LPADACRSLGQAAPPVDKPAGDCNVTKKIVIGVLIVFVIAIGGALVWVRSVLAQENVRVTLAAQLAKALGQPVTVGSVTATLYPRVAVRLNEVGIGNPVRVQVRALDLGTDFRALLSRRIEHATVHLDGARIELPLPPFEITASTVPASGPRRAPVELVSVDEIVLNDVEIVSGGRTLRGDVEASPHGNGLTLRKIALSADDTTITATGNIADLSGPTGELQIKAGTLNIDKLLAFANEFSAGTGMKGTSPAQQPATASTMNITVSVEADRATMGAMVLEKLTGRAALNGQELRLDPLAFSVFGGSYRGTIAVSMGSTVPSFRWRAVLADIDVAAATAFAGNPNIISGRLSGRIDLAGRGVDATTALRTARGSTHISVTNGIVKDLGLVRTVIAATSLDANAVAKASESRDEPFTRLGATFAIANGVATTRDLRFESIDLTLAAAGTARLDGSDMSLAGEVQLSEALTKQAAGSGGVLRIAQDNGRLTLPATVSGPAGAPRVRIDAAAMARRALRKTAAEQGEKLLKGALGGLIRR